MKRGLRLGTLTAFAASFVLAFLPSPAGADAAVVAVGWWTRSPAASAPEGGMTVGGAPDGPTSVAAVRLDLGAGVSSVTVTALEAGGLPDAATVRVCAASDAWSAADGGALEDAPEINCTVAVAFGRGDDGQWSADVTALVADRAGTVSLGFVAGGTGGDNPLTVAPFEVQFERPAVDSVPSNPTTSSPTSASTTTAVRRPPTSGFVPPPVTSPRVTSPPTTDPTTDTTVLSVVRPTTTTTIPIAEERAFPSVTNAGVSSSSDRPVREAFFLVALASLVGLGVGGVSRWLEARAV